MPAPVTISQLNRQIVINKYIFSQDDSGGNIKVLVNSYTLYANVQLISNSYLLEQLQAKYGEAYRITTRFEPDRLLTDNDEIVYDSKTHKIQGIRIIDEAAKRFNIINTSVSNSLANSNTGVFNMVTEFHYIASGGETGVTDDLLKEWNGRILLFRDKKEYRVITSGMPTLNQVFYNSTDGSFTFNTGLVPMDLNEPLDAYLIN